ncbi:hypothetical protein PoB_001820000 [Plakobranchus ocellatus]|uniref:Uncharacterized protein n=1 Tax=Plakobranchus ocellatus TaxID=259542 RepID=A0AAV3Z958_9GAST|nr:hypothetical protein PoB_001820000 [Plakobranchus ocellatus]
MGGIGGSVASESALRSAGIFLSRVRAPTTAPWPEGWPENLRSPCCGLALYKNQTRSLKWVESARVSFSFIVMKISSSDQIQGFRLMQLLSGVTITEFSS